MTWTQPLCNDCWDKEHPGTPARPGALLLGERCCMCGEPTRGIYIRRDPATVPYPRRTE